MQTKSRSEAESAFDCHRTSSRQTVKNSVFKGVTQTSKTLLKIFDSWFAVTSSKTQTDRFVHKIFTLSKVTHFECPSKIWF